MKMLGKGVLEVGNKEYLVISAKSMSAKQKDQGKDLILSVTDGQRNVFAARLFRIEKEKKDGSGSAVLGISYQYVTPRWITICGPFLINWFPEEFEFNVEDAWEYETIRRDGAMP